MKTLTVISDLPNVPSVYAMYGGQGSALHCAYVGVAGKLKQRVIQHLVRRDSSVTTGTSTVALNPELITQVRWWEHPEFGDRHILEAPELVAFDVLDPVLRSRGAMSDRAKELYKNKGFTDKMHNLFSGEPTGCLVILTLQDAFAKIAEIERRLKAFIARLSSENRTKRTQPEIHDFPLLQQFPTQFELLKRLFGDHHFLSTIINVRRLNNIFEISEKKWTTNLNRLKNEKVKYLLIAEAPLWKESAEARFWIGRMAK